MAPDNLAHDGVRSESCMRSAPVAAYEEDAESAGPRTALEG